MHETVARGVERWQGFRGQFLVEIKNFRTGWISLGRFDLRLQRLPGIDALPAKILDDETDVIGLGEIT